ncbi:MAG TPA: hypothetical protein DEO86_17430 [Colwellia sp.]|nr:hypothetical protein [Colwellia sp.]
MPDWFEKLLTFIKLPLKYLWVASLFSGVTLFLPIEAIEVLGLDIILEKYRSWLGTLFLFTTCLVLAELFQILYRKLKSNRLKSKQLDKFLERLYQLDPHEKSVIREFFIQQRNTLQLPFDNATVSGLLNYGVLQISSSSGERSRVGTLVAIKMTSKADNLITQDMIDLPDLDSLNESDKNWIKNNRPEFTLEIDRHNSTFHRSW